MKNIFLNKKITIVKFSILEKRNSENLYLIYQGNVLYITVKIDLKNVFDVMVLML